MIGQQNSVANCQQVHLYEHRTTWRHCDAGSLDSFRRSRMKLPPMMLRDIRYHVVMEDDGAWPAVFLILAEARMLKPAALQNSESPLTNWPKRLLQLAGSAVQ